MNMPQYSLKRIRAFITKIGSKVRIPIDRNQSNLALMIAFSYVWPSLKIEGIVEIESGVVECRDWISAHAHF